MTRAGIAPILIVLAELAGTSLWFSGSNAVPELSVLWGLSTTAKAWLLMAVQVGFILGTLCLAVSGLADAFRSHHVFALGALLGASANLGFLYLADSLETGLIFRLLTGLALAGIYPLGMKLIVSWNPESAGVALAWLVGALTLGTATPFLARYLGGTDWRSAVLASSILALCGGALVLILGEGPSARRSSGVVWGTLGEVFRIPAYRCSALGYFGHMWELYAFWAVVPVLVRLLLPEASQPLLVFLVIGIGAVGCVLGGQFSKSFGSRRVARGALTLSGLMCLLSPIIPEVPSSYGFGLLMVWGFMVVADSPQFSAMSAKVVPATAVGAALAAQNAIGFAITLISIQAAVALVDEWKFLIGWLLLPGPVLGVIALRGGEGPVIPSGQTEISRNPSEST